MLNEKNYEEALDNIRSELEDLLNEESRLEEALVKIRERYEKLAKAGQSLARLIGEEEEEESIGITDAIRMILKTGSERIWAPIWVRSQLKADGFPIERYKNPLAVIHTTLKRLEGQGEVRTLENSGKTYYMWIKQEAGEDSGFPF